MSIDINFGQFEILIIPARMVGTCSTEKTEPSATTPLNCKWKAVPMASIKLEQDSRNSGFLNFLMFDTIKFNLKTSSIGK